MVCVHFLWNVSLDENYELEYEFLWNVLVDESFGVIAWTCIS